MKKYRWIFFVIIFIAAMIFGVTGYHHYKQVRQQQEIVRQKEAEEEARKASEEAQQKKIEELTEEAQTIADKIDEVKTDEYVCKDIDTAVTVAEEVLKEVAAYREEHADEAEDLIEKAVEIIDDIETDVRILQNIKSIENTLAAIYDYDTKTAAMETGKNSKIFQDVQKEIWNIPDVYVGKHKKFEEAIQGVSSSWNYVNDEWHYESSTLKVSVEEKKTDQNTKYWICHVRIFSTDQLCSALAGDTYGNPRVPLSQEIADHNGVIGINGSGFSYNTGEPAPGKSMIKNGQIYNDVYSNGNIMCVTLDGGMFTAIAGMTTEEMINRSVKDTYCFGPTLVENGEAYAISGQFRETYQYQRSAVGMVNPGDYYLLVADGKGAGGSSGMNYEEMQKIFLDVGCQYAYNMDGGGSATLVFKGRVLNALTDGRERPVADILYFIDAGDGAEGDEIIIHDEEAMLQPPSE